jgi:hypothetical protein
MALALDVGSSNRRLPQAGNSRVDDTFLYDTGGIDGNPMQTQKKESFVCDRSQDCPMPVRPY